MEFSSTLRRFIYRIEPKPGGGFMATSKDSALPAIEGATREEVQQKIQERITAELGAQFPAFASALQKNDVKLHYHIEPKPGGGFIVHHGGANSTDPAHAPIEGSTREHLESLIESKLFSALMDRLPREIHQQIAAKINSGGLDVTADGKISVTTGSGSLFTPEFKKELTQFTAEAVVFDSGKTASNVEQASSEVPTNSVSLQTSGSTNQSPIIRYDSDSPVKYEKSSAGTLTRFLLALVIVAAVIYVLLHRH